MAKGQVEIIIVLAIVIVAVVAILLASQSPPEGQPATQEGRAVRNSLTRLISAGAQDSLRRLSLYGGYAEPQQPAVAFLGDGVNYWQRGGQVTVPAAQRTFTQLTDDFINANKESYLAGLGGDIQAGEARVQADIRPSTIDLTVTLPARVNEEQLSPVYRISIPSKFGDILSFAAAYSEAQSRDRYLEYYTLASMLMSPIAQGEQTTPLFISLSACGDAVMKTWFDLKAAAEERLQTTLAHTYLPGQVPLNIGDVTSYPKYALPEFDSNRFEDLEVTFHLPDDFQLTPGSFQVSPDPVVAFAQPIPLTGECASDPIYVKYFLNLPVIVRAKDPLTGNVFQFAQQFYIKDNAPGRWEDAALYEQDLQALICADTACFADVAVSSLSGAPVAGATVAFMGCSLGLTDSQGRFQGTAPCGLGPLQVYKTGFSLYSRGFSSDTLQQAQALTVPAHLSTTVNVYKVNVLPVGDTYQVTNIEPLPPGNKAMLTVAQDRSYTFFFDAVGQLQNVPAGGMGFLAAVMNREATQAWGQVELPVTIPEGTAMLHVYIPYSDEFNVLSQSGDHEAVTQLGLAYTELMEQCGIGPVTTTPVDRNKGIGCIKTKAEVQP
ncbi:MAG: hypothetical protein HY520_04650 [Candidatus Aenigmarchaeota archaeon]|nr:hypothetical protein [Candidatus Aenigmarchaeota archaeon]